MKVLEGTPASDNEQSAEVFSTLQLIAAGCEVGLNLYRVSLDRLQDQLNKCFDSALADLQVTLPGGGKSGPTVPQAEKYSFAT